MLRISVVTFLLLCWPLPATELEVGGTNVATKTVYWKHTTYYACDCVVICFGRCTKYTKKSEVRAAGCKSGWASNNNKDCTEPVCDGRTNPDACNIRYSNSHIIINNQVKMDSGGVCDEPNKCVNCNPGFFDYDGYCRICTNINRCDFEQCTSLTDSVCSECEGTVKDIRGQRAYFTTTGRKTCHQACSWRDESTFCYPGTCTTEYSSSCQCADNFRGKKCLEITKAPTIAYNQYVLRGDNGARYEGPPDVNSGEGQADRWFNVKSFNTADLKLEAHFMVPSQPRPVFIEGFKVGITKAWIDVKSPKGSKSIGCRGVTRANPDVDLFTCDMSVDPDTAFFLPFNHRDRIELTYTVENGGVVNVRNMESNLLEYHYYDGLTTSRTFRFNIDLVTPYHCTGSEACVNDMLSAPNLIKTNTISITWDGWQDDDSGISNIVVELYDVKTVGQILRQDSRIQSTSLAPSAKSHSYTLPAVGIYAVILSVHDVAGNHKTARRMTMYDDTSTVATKANTELKVTTRSSETSEWQTTSSPVTVDWSNRYVNVLHFTNLWLNNVEAVHDIDSQYDDNEGIKRVTATDNVQGIVDFKTAFKTDHNGGFDMEGSPSKWESQGLAQTQTITPSLQDGDTLRFWIQAFDIKSDFKEESVTVHIDTTPPVIEDLWLTKGDRLDFSVHGLADLSEMTIEWYAYDEHSGLEEVSWKIEDTFFGRNGLHGIQHLTAQGETTTIKACQDKYSSSPRGEFCYCTPAKGCYHRHFQVKPPVVDNSLPHGGIFNDKNTGTHEFDYHIEVTVKNHAKLTSTKRYKITLDLSPPVAGSVHDGISGEPEVDYQDSLDLTAHWDEFFDKESGVKFFQYKFGDKCFGKDDFGLDKTDVTETTSSNGAWSAPGAGKYYITVVAYNRALEPSDPVCSDGVTVDTTPPTLSEIDVADTRVREGLVKTPDDRVWFIDAQRRRVQVLSSDPLCSSQATPVDDSKFSLFPAHRLENGTGLSVRKDSCDGIPGFDSTFFGTFYLFKETHMFINWTGEDAESGIFDYEVGLSSGPDGASPDIVPFTSTHHHPHYYGYHPGVSEGQRFYVAVKAINKAGLSTTKVLGPGIVHTLRPTFTAPINVEQSGDYLVATWSANTFSDSAEDHLKYDMSVGSSEMNSIVLPFTAIKGGVDCTLATPPTCAAVAVKQLEWDLHHGHAYLLSVRVTNVVGLATVGVSNPYVPIRAPSSGVVLDLVPSGEEHIFEITSFEDTDHTVSMTTISARWYGFENSPDAAEYQVAVGTSPSTANVKEFESVGTSLQHTFTNMSLRENQKYHVIVKANIGTQETTSSSDGVYVVKEGAAVSDVTVKDGPGCLLGDSLVIDNECPKEEDFQISTSTYAAHWTVQDDIKTLYPEVMWSLQKKLPRTEDLWEKAREFEDVGSAQRLLASGLSLEPGITYRVALKFCAGTVCTKPVYSDGTAVIPHPPKTGSMSIVNTEISDGKAKLDVTFSKFRDADILDPALSLLVMERYEWTLADNSRSSRLFQGWQRIAAESMTTDEDKIQFAITLPRQLDFTKCRRLLVRGYNVLGIYSIASADVRDCAAFDPAQVVPAVVLDAYGKKLGENMGTGVTLAQNDDWDKTDVDYVPYKNILSAVWPELRHRNYTWAVVAGDNFDPVSHYKREEIMKVTDPCSIPGVITCGQTDKEFVNVQFSSDSYLEHGKRFYVCIHADQKNVPYEKWTANLDETNTCSDGVTVDLTPPGAGTVTIKGVTKDGYQISSTEVDASWSGFTDVEEEGDISHPSGISHYQIALGSVPMGQDIVTFTNVGLVDHVTLHSLNLPPGQTLYATVRAMDFVGKSTDVSSGGFLVDNTAPVLSGRQIQIQEPYAATAQIHVCWTDVFIDEESGMKGYTVAVGSRPGYDDIFNPTSTDQDCTVISPAEPFTDGHSYFVTVKGYNNAGLYTERVSGPITADSSPPLQGHVYDGLLADATSSSKDSDFITDAHKMGAHWVGFEDPHSPVSMFLVKVGTCAGCENVVKEFEYGLRNDIAYQHIPFSVGVKYFTTVKACTVGGLCSTSSTDGVVLDLTPPVTGFAFDGTGDTDIEFQASTSLLGCKWRGFLDVESGLHHYEWEAKTSAGATILTSRSTGLEEVAFHVFPKDKPLPTQKRIICTVRAFNKAGLFTEVSSNGVIIDSTPPSVTTSPTFLSGPAILVPGSTVSRSVLVVSWEFQDGESFIERQYISLSSHRLGEFQTSTMKIPGVLKQYTFTKLDLHDGSAYKVKVTACNAGGLCTSAATGETTVDSSRPSSGTLAIGTDRAVKFSREHPGWMTYTDDMVKLAWLGFLDSHSGIKNYMLTVGSKEFADDHNKDGSPIEVTHVKSGSEIDNEGVIQTAEIGIKDLPPEGSIYVAIWAVNNAGLISDPYTAQLALWGDGIFWLIRRCKPYSCEGHCSCHAQLGKCAATSGCTELSNGGANSIVSVDDLPYQHPLPTPPLFSALDSMLAARLSVTVKGLPIYRLEVSVGESSSSTPTGIFSVGGEKVWYETPQDEVIVFSLPRGKTLTKGLKYSVFVRAWYDKDTYSVFKSEGVTIDVTPPSLSQKVGRGVKELAAPASGKDIDFQTSQDRILLSWSDRFTSGLSGIRDYQMYVSTSPGGHDIHASAALQETSYTASSLTLLPNTVYYTSVIVHNKAGLVSWSYSDGVQVDITSPMRGYIQDGTGLHDLDYQSAQTEISASSSGFTDFDSLIVKYFWCVGNSDNTDECSILPWQDVGLHTSYRKTFNSPFTNGFKVWNKVYAIDAVGHRTEVAVSDGVTIDVTPPEAKTVVYLGNNVLQNPSFEADGVAGSPIACNHMIPTPWETDSQSCVKVMSPDSPLAKHGLKFVSVSGFIWQEVTNLNVGQEYKLTVHTGYPETVGNHNMPLKISVAFGSKIFSYDLDPALCKGSCEAGDDSVILWNKHTFRVKATNTSSEIRIGTSSRTMEMVLDDVNLQRVDYSEGGGASEADGLDVSRVFLSHWSSLHAEWHFVDPESPIVEYQWAIGSSPGGNQLQNFRSVGRHTQGTASGLQLTHDTSVYVTILATNAVGLTTLKHSAPIKVDHTPPVFVYISDGAGGKMDEDFQSSPLVTVTFKADDPESAVDRCDWAIGTTPGRADIHSFTRLPSAAVDISSRINSSSLTVYSTVRCFNLGGLVTLATTDGVEVIPQRTGRSVGSFSILEEDQRDGNSFGTCHHDLNKLRLKWDETGQSFKSVVVGLNRNNVLYERGVTKTMEYSFATLEHLNLQKESTNHAYIYPLNVLGEKGETTFVNFTVFGSPPSTSDEHTLVVSQDGTTATVSWEKVFTSLWNDLEYQVTVGTQEAAADIVEKVITKNLELTLTLTSLPQGHRETYVTVSATDSCGLSSFVSRMFTLL